MVMRQCARLLQSHVLPRSCPRRPERKCRRIATLRWLLALARSHPDDGRDHLGERATRTNESTVVWVNGREQTASAAWAMATAFTARTTGARGWKNMGLKSPRHIGALPRPAGPAKCLRWRRKGPLWDRWRPWALQVHRWRKTWKAAMTVSENTGSLMSPGSSIRHRVRGCVPTQASFPDRRRTESAITSPQTRRDVEQASPGFRRWI